MAEIHDSIEIGRPVADVFAYLSDPQNNTKWEKGVVVSEHTSEGPPRVGITGRRVEKSVGTDEAAWTMTEYEAEKVIAFDFESQRARGSGRWSFEASDGGTRVSYRFEAYAKGLLWKLLLPPMLPLSRGKMKRDYVRLKGLLESEGS